MQIRRKSRRILITLLAIALLLATGCSSDYERSNKPAGDWSRGLLLGESNIRQAVALEVDADRLVHMAWIEATSDEAEGLHYVQLNREGQVNVDRALSIDLSRPRSPQLLVDAGDDLHLALLARSDGRQALYHAQMDAEGRVTELKRLSGEEENVDSYHVDFSPAGEIRFTWASEPAEGQPGIYQLALPARDVNSPSLLVPDGTDPFILVERTPAGDTATTHMVWTYRTGFSQREIYYATLKNGQLMPSEGQHITTFGFAESATYQPPVIGLDSGTVYVIWSVQNLGGGLTPTEANTFYVSFAPGKADYIDPRNVKLPSEHRPDYDDHTSPYGITALTPLSPDVRSTDFINAPAVVQNQESELPVVVSVIIESASKQFIQLALTVLEGGDPVGYQLANETSNASVLPTLAADQNTNLHLAWLDTAGFRRYKVYYATTAPQASTWLNRTTVKDIGEQAASLAWGVLSAVGFLPLTLMWNAPALVWLIVFYAISHQELLDELGAKIALGVSFAIYLVVKMLFLPGLLEAGTPFVYLVPQEIAPMLTTIIPVLILLLALVGLIIYLRRPGDGRPPALFKAYLIFALVDSALTAILYAPRFFNPRG